LLLVSHRHFLSRENKIILLYFVLIYAFGREGKGRRPGSIADKFLRSSPTFLKFDLHFHNNS
jgi:hypothetical protein